MQRTLDCVAWTVLFVAALTVVVLGLPMLTILAPAIILEWALTRVYGDPPR